MKAIPGPQPTISAVTPLRFRTTPGMSQPSAGRVYRPSQGRPSFARLPTQENRRNTTGVLPHKNRARPRGAGFAPGARPVVVRSRPSCPKRRTQPPVRRHNATLQERAGRHAEPRSTKLSALGAVPRGGTRRDVAQQRPCARTSSGAEELKALHARTRQLPLSTRTDMPNRIWQSRLP